MMADPASALTVASIASVPAVSLSGASTISRTSGGGWKLAMKPAPVTAQVGRPVSCRRLKPSSTLSHNVILVAGRVRRTAPPLIGPRDIFLVAQVPRLSVVR